jgi:hypothetical protein
MLGCFGFSRSSLPSWPRSSSRENRALPPDGIVLPLSAVQVTVRISGWF